MLARTLAHAGGALGAALVCLFALGATVPPAEEFPDSLLGAFHTFFVGIIADQDGLPDDNHPNWMDWAEPGDVIFVSRGHVAWGTWSHVAVVVRAPADAVLVRPGTLAVLDASIHDGMYLSPLAVYARWPRVVIRRASHDPEVRRRIADHALTHRQRLFASVVRTGAPYSNCTATAIESLETVGLSTGLVGWRTPDELYRSAVWVP